MAVTHFLHPAPPRAQRSVWPVFFPFMGCPGRCVFCAQDKQTGTAARSLPFIFERFKTEIEDAAAGGGGPYEIGFYGGAFTALPEPWPERFTALAGALKARGVVTRARCSTRPDAASPALLARLRDLGLDLVEIGVQTFDADVLRASGRRHGPEASLEACEAVKSAGLSLGVQLLPGLPGHDPAGFLRDAVLAAGLGPECARLYPCLVVEGTRLAEMYRRGEYAPWNLAETVDALARGALIFWRAGVRLARIGLAPQPELDEAVLAGPKSPALGTSVRARALHLYIRSLLQSRGGLARSLAGPRKAGGEFWGHGRELAPEYAALGLFPKTVRFENRPDFRLEAEDEIPAS